MQTLYDPNENTLTMDWDSLSPKNLKINNEQVIEKIKRDLKEELLGKYDKLKHQKLSGGK